MSSVDLKSLPKTPGVYLFKNKSNDIIYIGKAKNLHNRVSSYFRSNHDTSPKTQFLVRNISSVDTISVDSEVEALLLENKLIKKHTPKYNINLKDAKTYAYIKITNEKIPRIISSRRVTSDGTYFGPFTDGTMRRELISLTARIFKLVTYNTFSTKSRLNYDIGIAPAPTLAEINSEQYLKQVEKAKKFLSGKNTIKIENEIQNQMENAASKSHYEEALECRQQIESLHLLRERQKVDLIKTYDQGIVAFVLDSKSLIIQVFSISRGVLSGKREYKFDYYEGIYEEFLKIYYSSALIPHEILLNVNFWKDEKEKKLIEEFLSRLRGTIVKINVPQKGEKKALVEMAIKNAKLSSKGEDVLSIIKKNLKLSQTPKIIECFDMSNLGSEHVVGGMTRFVNGKRDLKGSRKFEVKSSKGRQDDFAAMREVIYRRYKKLKEEHITLPDLVIVDGGKGQLSSAISSLKFLGLDKKIPIVGLAKREEEIFVPNKSESLKFNKNSEMMLFIRMIRDSTHNYVISYNRKKREMKMKKEMV